MKKISSAWSKVVKSVKGDMVAAGGEVVAVEASMAHKADSLALVELPESRRSL